MDDTVDNYSNIAKKIDVLDIINRIKEFRKLDFKNWVYPKFCVNRPKMQNEAVEFEPGGDLPPGFVYYIRYRTPITAGRYRPTGIGVLLHKTDNRNRI